MFNQIMEQLRDTAIISAMTAGIDRETIEENGIGTEDVDEKDAKAMCDAGKLIHMSNAATAASLMEQFKIQGFTREEAIPLIASVLRK